MHAYYQKILAGEGCRWKVNCSICCNLLQRNERHLLLVVLAANVWFKSLMSWHLLFQLLLSSAVGIRAQGLEAVGAQLSPERSATAAEEMEGEVLLLMLLLPLL
jgi:hypothetical protein